MFQIIELEIYEYAPNDFICTCGRYPEIVGTGTTEQEAKDNWDAAYDSYYND